MHQPEFPFGTACVLTHQCDRLERIVCTGSQQLLCRHQQTTLGLTSNEMLLYTAGPKSAFLLLVGPQLDRVVTQGAWIFEFEFSTASSAVILATCLLAVGVNLSQFMCLGRCSAAAYQARS